MTIALARDTSKCYVNLNRSSSSSSSAYNVPTAGTQASSLREGVGHNPPRGPRADW